MEINVVDPSTSEPVEASVPESKSIAGLTDLLIGFFDLPRTDAAGRALVYALARGGTELATDATLAEAGVREGDVLEISARSRA